MKTNLSMVHDPSFWPFYSWQQFADMTCKSEKVIIIPVVGFSDWRLALPLDIEEVITMMLLKECLGGRSDAKRFLVVPPVRFNLGKKGFSSFTTDPDTAHATLESIAGSIKESGFRKILFLNSSPWNEDLVDCAGRDLRIKFGLQPFCINLSSIGLNFLSHTNRENLVKLSAFLLNKRISPPETKPPLASIDLFPENECNDFSLRIPETNPSSEGHAILLETVKDLSGLLSEVFHFRPLTNGGRIPSKLL